MKLEKGDSIAVIEYHTTGKGEVGKGDKDAFNNADGNGRTSYYAVPGVPDYVFNGTKQIVGGWSGATAAFRDSINQQKTINTPGILTLRLLYNSSTRKLNLHTSFYSVDQITETNLKLRTALTESHMHYHWGGGSAPTLDSLQFIERKMLPTHSGTAFTINQGGTYERDDTLTVNSTWVDSKCDLVVWVQSDVSTYVKKVLISNQIPLFNHVPGDANGDKVTTISDVVFLFNYLFFHSTTPSPFSAGDANADCNIDIADAVYLIVYLFHDGPAPYSGCAN
jgi:hypothetical protein